MLSDNGCNSLSISNMMICSSFQCAPRGIEVQLVKEIVSTNGVMVTNPILPSLLWP